MNSVDPLGLFRSSDYLRSLVPGQVMYNESLTALENGNYGLASLYFAGMIGEQVMFALTFGKSSAILKGATVCEINANNVINQTSKAILKNGYYEVNGFKFSEYYYNKLWDTGRGGPSLVAKEVLEGATEVVSDTVKEGFYKYIFGGWEMVYNPTTKEVWHLMPVK